jgi:hypothetical protein
MKRLVFAFASVALAISCTVNPDIVPDPSPASSASSGAGGFGGNDPTSSVSSSASSSSSGAPLPGDGSGSRLKRRLYSSGDGLVAARAESFYDTLLSAVCVPRSTAQGFRCVPFEPAFSAGFYSDAACTTPALIADKTCTIAPYYNTTKAATCNDTLGVMVYTVTVAAAQIAFRKVGTMCTALLPDQLNIVTVYDIGPEVDYTTFALMTLGNE